MHYWDVFVEAFQGYAHYVRHDLLHPHKGNYIYWLLGISLAVYALELLRPWRRNQARIRRDFWQDAFYMFFNFFIFSLVGYHAVSQVVVEAFQHLLGTVGITNLVAVRVDAAPVWMQLLTLFVLRDVVQYFVHRLLHRVPWLWEVHKVHHSVREMGFAAHLRFHPLETAVYRTLEYLPLALIGFGIDDFLIVHLTALTIGHLNHANFVLPMGPLKYVFNNAPMHIWHHAAELPADKPYGINFGISLSVWDYLFGTARIPHDGRDIPLGFPDLPDFPDSFTGHLAHPFRRAG